MITLHRIDPARNMARFYSLDVQPTLFGEWSLVREWGRVHKSARRMIELHRSAEEAQLALERTYSRKARRGYTQ